MAESTEFVDKLAGLSNELKLLVDSMGADRRTAGRIPLDSPYSLTLSGAGMSAIRCRLPEISLSGMRLELPGGASLAGKSGDTFHLETSQGPLSNCINGIGAKLIWEDGLLSGFEFLEHLKGMEASLEEAVSRS